MWLWTGVAHHGMTFSAISNGAWGFAALFVIQGLLFIKAGALRGRLPLARARPGPAGWAGRCCLISIAYPVLGQLLGHAYLAMPMFGITPCPLTIFTFGLFLLTTEPMPHRLLVVPVVWSLIGGSGAFLLDVPQNWPLFVSSLVVLVLLKRDRDHRRDASEGRLCRDLSAGVHPEMP